MITMFTSTLPRLSDYFPSYPDLKKRIVMVEAAGATIGLLGLLFMMGVIPLWIPLAVWIVAASLDLTTIEWDPAAGRAGLKAFSLFFADLCMWSRFSDVYYPPQLLAGPLFAAAIWMMVRHQPDKETA